MVGWTVPWRKSRPYKTMAGAKAGYGVFLAIATRPGVGTTRLYISWAYPESLRSRSGSTVHPSTGTAMHIWIQLTRVTAIAHSRRPRYSQRPHTPASRIPACAARRVGQHEAQDSGLAPKWSRERSCHARTQHEVSNVRGQAIGEAREAHS